MNLRLLHVGEWLDKCLSMSLMFPDVMTEAREYFLIEHLGFVFCLLMIRCCLPMFDTKRGGHVFKTPAFKMV